MSQADVGEAKRTEESGCVVGKTLVDFDVESVEARQFGSEKT